MSDPRGAPGRAADVMRVRFEVMPFARAVEEAAQLPARVRLTVTCSPRHGPDESVAVATQLRGLGHSVTVHLAARMIRDRAHLDELLGRTAEAGVDDAFVIGGDAVHPYGVFRSALELLREIHEHPRRPRTLGIAGYPEGHPLIDVRTLAAALAEKSRLADYVTTQLCFDPGALLRWVEETRQAGVTLPVLVGIPGVVDRRRLLEISVRIGVGPSLSFLRKQGGLRNLLRLSASRSGERLHGEIAPHVGDGRLEIAGFHYYTFNRLVDTWRWERAKREERARTA